MARISVYKVAPPKKDLPFNPYVHIFLSEYSQDEGHILLSPRLMTDEEIDYSIDRLRKQLETARKKAKLELKKQKRPCAKGILNNRRPLIASKFFFASSQVFH